MNRLDIQIQAEKFIAYFSKVPASDLDAVFTHWAESKDFEPADHRAIWTEIRNLLRKKSGNKV